MLFKHERGAGEQGIGRKQNYGPAKLHHLIEYGSRHRG
jgi:hypothetical protein